MLLNWPSVKTLPPYNHVQTNVCKYVSFRSMNAIPSSQHVLICVKATENALWMHACIPAGGSLTPLWYIVCCLWYSACTSLWEYTLQYRNLQKLGASDLPGAGVTRVMSCPAWVLGTEPRSSMLSLTWVSIWQWLPTMSWQFRLGSGWTLTS